MSENYLTINENGEPLTETISGVTMPIDYSFANINDFVNGVDVHFEELQSLCLGMSCHIEQQAETIERLEKQLEELMHKDTEKAVTIERLKQGMKGDYDLDQWLDWAVSKKHMMETIERLNSRNKRLLNAMNTMRDDLLAGAPEAEDGTVFINVKRDVWEYFCAVIDNTENKLEAGEL